jgi:hypothetical protein
MPRSIPSSAAQMDSRDFKENATTHIDFVDAHKKAAKPVVGTIRLFDENGIVLIPTPTRDPNGKLTVAYPSTKS